MPLPQDTAIFDANSFSGSATLTIANARIGSLDMSAVDEAVTVSVGNFNLEWYGSMKFNNNITWSQHKHYTSNLYNVHGNTINTGNWNNNMSLIISKGMWYFSGNSRINGFYGIKVGGISGLGIGLDFNDYDVEISYIDVSYTTSWVDVYLGNGTITVVGSTHKLWEFNFGHLYPENSTLIIDSTVNNKFYVARAGQTWNYNNVYIKSVKDNIVTVFGGGANFNDLKIEPGLTAKFTAGNTYTLASLTAIGTSENPITITSATAAQHTLTKSGEGKVFIDNCDISYSNVDANKFYATNCIDSGNNTNWIFVKVGKIMSKWYSNANKIAGVSRNKIEKIMEVR